MIQYVRCLFISLLILGLASPSLKAQYTVTFTSNLTANGCSIGTYAFASEVRNGGVVQSPTGLFYHWDFGNGTSTGAQQLIGTTDVGGSPIHSPNRSYLAPGIYTVLLRVYSAGTPVFGAGVLLAQVTQQVTIYTSPSPDFSADVVDVCLGDPVTFTDFVNYGAQPYVGAVTSRNWNFGDGNQTLVSNPATNTVTYTYTTPGDYQVTLTTRTFGGRPGEECAAAIQRPAYISVRHKPVASFTVNPVPPACNLPYAPVLTNTSTIASTPAPAGAIASYVWRFYSGATNMTPELPFSPINTITNAPPSIPPNAYTAAGTYAITLEAVSSAGCRNVTTRLLTINPPQAVDFNLPVTTQICAGGTVTFTDASLPGATSYSWTLSGATPATSSLPNPTVTFATSGTYGITLNVTYPDGCVRTVSKSYNVTVAPPPVANFTNSPTDGFCSVPKNVTFTPLQAQNPNYTYTWNFGENIGPGLTGPIAIGYSLSNIYEQFGTYNVNLTVRDNITGCETTVTRVLTLVEPVLSIVPRNPVQGCAPLFVNFDISMNSIEPIVQYRIDYDGDGTYETTVVPTHTPPTPFTALVGFNYTNRGNFIPAIEITTLNGCVKRVTSNRPIRIGTPPQILSITQIGGAGGCQGTGIGFTPVFAPGFEADSVIYGFTDGGSATVTAPPFTTNRFFTQNGAQGTTVTAFFNGCPITVPFNYSIPGGGIQSPIAALQVVGGTPDVCTGLPTNNQVCVNISGTIASPTAPTTYVVNFGDGNSQTFSSATPAATLSNICNTYLNPGTYIITLTATGNNGAGCVATRQQTVTISPDASVTVDFSITPNPAISCAANTVGFSSTSIVTAPGISITSYIWNFGDGSPIQTLAAPAGANTTHTYTPSATAYNPTLTLLLSNGCTKVYSGAVKVVNVQGPILNITATPSLLGCVGDVINFQGLATLVPAGNTIVSWDWDFGDPTSGVNNVATSQNAGHIFNAPGFYTVTLRGRDNNSLQSGSPSAPGCIATRTVQVQIFPKPTASFVIDRPAACVGAPISFTSTAGAGVTSYLWNFGDGNTSTVANPTYTYATPGTPGNSATRTISLTVTNAAGCQFTTTRSFEVVNVDFAITANGSSSPITLNCPPKVVNFTSSFVPAGLSLTGWTFNWQFGDGNQANTQNATNEYNSPSAPSIFTVIFTATNTATGCSIVKTLTNFITVTGPRGTFSFVPTNLCKPGVVTFTASGLSGNPTQIQWDFGDGSANVTQPITPGIDPVVTHTYTTSGSFLPNITLIDGSIPSCRVAYPSPGGTRVNVSGVPNANFTWTGGGLLCKDILVNFTDLSTPDPLTGPAMNPQVNRWAWTIYDGVNGPDQAGTDDPIIFNSAAQNPTYTFTTAKTYLVRLNVRTAFNAGGIPDGCPAYIDRTITIVDPTITASITAITPLNRCPNEPVTFSGLANTNVNPKTLTGTWNVYQNPVGVTIPDKTGPIIATFNATAAPGALAPDPWSMSGNFAFPTAGTYTIELLARDVALCTGGAVATQVVTVDPLPSFIANPNNQAICVGQGTTFTVTPSAASLAAPGVDFQWQQSDDAGVTWVNIVNGTTVGGSVYAGATTDNLTITNGSFLLNGYRYRAVIIKRNTTQCQATSGVGALTVNQNATVATVIPANAEVCNQTTYALNGNTPVIGTGLWTKVSGPAGGTITTPNSPTSTITSLQYGTYTYQWTISNGVCPTSSATFTITNVQPANAGTNQNLCAATSFNLSANNPVTTGSGVGAVGTWTLVSGPVGAPVVTFAPNANTPNATVNNVISSATPYVFQWTITGALSCGNSSAQVSILNSPLPIVTNPLSQTVCVGQNATLSVGNSATVGYQWQVFDTGAGTFINISDGVNYTGVTTPTLTINTPTVAFSGFRYRVLLTNTTTLCTNTTSEATLTVFPANTEVLSLNTPSPICIGSNAVVRLSTTKIGYTYQLRQGVTPVALVNIINGDGNPQDFVAFVPTATATYNVLVTSPTANSVNCQQQLASTVTVVVNQNPSPSVAGADRDVCGTTTTLNATAPAVGIGAWSVITGPAVIAPANVSNPNAPVTGLQLGVNRFRWTVSNGVCPPTISEVVITGRPVGVPANAGTDQRICSTITTNATLAGNNPGATGSGTWTTVGPATAMITNPTVFNSGVTGLSVGVNTFRWTVLDLCTNVTTFDDIVIILETAPSTATVTAPINVCGTTNATLAANTPTSGTGIWTVVAGTGLFASATNPNTTVSGLSNGINTFRWTVSNTCGNSSADLNVTVSPAASVANAGLDRNICANTVNLNATLPVVGVGTWSVRAGGGTIAPADLNNRNAPVTGLTPGVNTFRWTINDGCGNTNFADVNINVQSPPTAAAAGTNQTRCGLGTVTMAANAPNAANGEIGQWFVTAGTGVFANVNSSTSTVSGLSLGANTFEWRITNTCNTTISPITVTVLAPLSPAAAGPDQALCASNTILGATAPVSGVGRWSIISITPAAPAPTIVDITNPNSLITNLPVGSVTVLRWTVGNGGTCADIFDDVNITSNSNSVFAYAGPNVIQCGNTVILQANTPTAGTNFYWTLAPGTSVVTGSLGTPGGANGTPTLTVTGLALGSNVFRWTVGYIGTGCSSAISNVDITRVDNTPTSVAGANQTICQTAGSTTLNGNTPSIGAGAWSVVSVPSGANLTDITFVNAALPNTVANGFNVVGNYVLRWTISNGACTPSASTVQIAVTAPPTTSNAGAAQTICVDNATLNATNVTVGQGTWSVVSTPSGAGTLTFSNVNLRNAVVSGLTVAGNYILKWTSRNLPCADSESTVTITRVASPTVSNAGANQTICQTVASVTLAGNTPLVGSGLWTVAAPGGATVTFSNNTSPTANATGLTVAGVYTFTWTISNAPCLPNSTSTVQVTVTAPPTPSNAGIAQTICANSTVLAATAVTVGQGTWTVQSVPSGTGAITFSDINSPTATVNGLTVAGNYILKWTSRNLPCADSESTVTITRVASPTVSNAGANQTICATSYVLNGNTPAFGTGTWSVVAPLGATVTFSNVNNPTATANGLTVNGVYTFTWTIANAPCANSASSVSITVNAPPTIATVGATQDICGAITTLTGNNPTIGTGTWTVIAGGATVNFPNQFNSTVSGMTAGVNRFRWTITNGTCASSSADLLVNSFAPPSTASAGTNSLACAVDGILSASVPTAGTGTWTLVSGSGTIVSPNSPTTAVNGLAIGANVFRWTVTNGVCPSAGNFSDVTLTRRGSVSLSVAGVSQTICGATYNLNANVPNAALGEVGTWSVLGGATIAPADINNPAAVATNLVVGFNQFTWTVTNGCATSVASIIITRNDNVTPSNAGTPQIVCATTAQLSGNAPTVGTGAWTVVSGSGVFANASQFNTMVSGLGVGANVFRWTISNGATCTPSFSDVTITSTTPPSVAVAGANQTICADNTILAATAPAIGTGAWTVVSGTGTIVNPTLVNAQVTNLSVGANILRWTTSNGTCPVSTNDVIITREAPPTPSFAGADQSTCNTTYTLAANTPTVGSGVWTVTAGTAVVTNPNSPTSTVTNLSFGVNTFAWTVTNGSCPPSVTSVNITRTSPATIASVGANQTTCLTTAALTGNTAAIGTGIWAVTAGTATITDINNPASGVTGLSIGVNTFRWRISNACGFTDAFLTITREIAATVATAGTNQTTCNTFFNALSGNVATSGTGIWTVTAGGATVTDVNNPASGVTGLTLGVNTFRWTISNTCSNTFAEVSITRDAPATVASVGVNQVTCLTTATLTGNTATIGIGAWTVTAGTATVTDPTNPASGVTGLTVGINTFRWRISNACGFTDAFLTITRDATATVASVGTNQNTCNTFFNALSGNTATVGTGIWTVTAGGATVTDVNNPTSGVTGLTLGVNTFRWTISNTCSNTFAEVSITRDAAATIASVGINQTTCLTTATLTGNTAIVGTGVWTVTAGTGTITDVNNPTSGVTGLGVGVNTFRWRISNTCGFTDASVSITRQDLPTPANAGAPQSICASTTTLNGNIPTVGVGTWALVTAPLGFAGAVTFGNVNQGNSTVSGLTQAGDYIFSWTTSNGICATSTAQVTVSVIPLAFTANGGAAQNLCSVTTTNLTGNAVAGTTGAWTQVSGAATTLVNANTPNLTVNGLTTGAYTFRWTLTGGSCAPSTSDVIVRVAEPANAGPDQNLCSVTTATLAGNTPVVGTGTWTQVSGATATISSINSPNSGITGLTTGTYTFRWTVTGSPCGTTVDDIVINVVGNASAGVNQIICNTTNTTLAATAPVIGTGTWTATPNAGVTITNPNSPTSTVSGLTLGTVYTFTWTISGTPCVLTPQNITITVSPLPNAGIDQALCNVTTATLAGNTPLGGATGTWSQIAGASATISNINSPTSGITGLTTGTYTFRWTFTGGSCATSSDDMVITVTAPANAGINQNLCGVSTTNLAATPPITGIGTWTKISGPVGGAIANANSATTSVTGLVNGTYVFQWEVTGGACPTTNSQMTILVSSPADAGIDISVCSVTSVVLGALTPTTGTGAWSQISGPSAAAFSGNVFNATASNLQTGTYTFRWTISGSACTPSFDDVVVRVSENANAGADQAICNVTAATLAGNIAVTGIGTWTQISGNPATITSPTSPTSTVTGLITGSYTFQWTFTGGICGNSNDQVVINVSAPTSAGANQSLCGATSTNLSATAPVAGTGLWTQVLGPGIASISNTGIINPTVSGLVAGTYVFRWTITGVACPNLFSEVTIVNSSVPNAGTNQTICLGSPLILQANTVAVGTGQWSQVSGASTAFFTNASSPTSAVTNLSVGTYIFRWTVTGATCSQNTSDVTMTVIGVTPTNASASVSDMEYCDNQIPPSATVTIGTTQNGMRYELRRADNSLVASQVSAGSSLTFTITPAPTSTTTYTVVAIPNIGAVSCSPVELADKGIVTVKVCEKQSIGLAKTVLPLVVQPNGSVNVTYLLTVRNLGNTELTNIQINDDLTTVFPAPATYSIVSPPSASGGLFANTAYTGTAANPNVLTGLGRLSAGETQTVSFTLNLIPNALSGNYINSAVARGERGSIVVTDRSTDGVNVDPDNDGDPRENTPTPFTLPANLSRPRIGVAKNLFTTARQANGSYNITYQMTVRNYGNVELTNVQIIDDLAATFPSPAQFSIVGTPSATGSLTVNASYTGRGASNVLVNGGRLAVGESQTVTLTVNLIPNTTNATYRNTATASGENGTNRVTDNSTDGISPDPNGDGDPREESPTPFVLPADNNNNSGRPLLGVAKSLTAVARQTDGSYNVTYSISVRNYGNVALNNLQVSDDLTATFPAPAVFRIVGAPSATGSLTANAAFTGTGSNTNLLNGGTLAVGETQTITFSVNLTPNAATAFYRNTAVGSGENGTNRVTDSSTDGLNPDPNGDGSPDENIPTLFSIPADRPQIGVAKNLLSAVRQANGSFNLTYLVTLRNYGNIALSNVQVTDNLTNTFPSPAQFSVTTPPLATGNLVGNTGFTGTGGNINLLSGGSLGIGERQSITFTVNMTPNASTGSFRNTAIGRGEGGGVPTTDTSTDGLNPDPDNNGNPSEESPTIFNLPTDNNNNNNRPLIGVSKNLLTPARQADGSYNFTYQINVRNYGNAEITNVQVIDDLTATFPAPATFRVISAPTSIGNLTTNPNYTGRAGNNNLLNGSGRLGIGESQTITFTVNVIPNANGATYRNTAIGTGSAGGVNVTDNSSEGSNPDPNGDGNPSEDVPTTFVLQPETIVPPIATRFSFTTDNCSSTVLTEKIILQNSGLVKITLLPNTVTALRGVVSISTDGTMIYRPALNAVGLDSLEYEICNSINVCAKGKIYINVLACTSQPPVIRPDEFGTDNCTEVKGNVLTNDTDPNGTVLKAKVVTNRLTVSGGVYSIAADGTFSYLPPKGFVGRDSMTYEACNSVPTLSKCGAAKIYVDVLDCQETFIPEGFSPNGDGVNDVFTIKGAERFDIKVQIFNRWGNLIYEDDHYKNTWDGIATVGILVGAGVPDGTYYYIVDFRNGQKPKVGFLTVQR